MKEDLYSLHTSEVGQFLIVESQKAIVEVFMEPEGNLTYDGVLRETPLIDTTWQQLQEYFLGQRKDFTIPLAPRGTPFQLSVWKALLDIPYGETRSYKEIAMAIGNPKAVRAVGMANHRNPISFIIPCHRVIGANGALVGYGGGIDLKKRLLDMERANSR
jgi:methylated-DNA-[protein]-cysteine S-methyltransferase